MTAPSTFSTGMMYSVLCFDSHTPESRADWERVAAAYPAPLSEIRYFLAPCGDLHPDDPGKRPEAHCLDAIPERTITADLPKWVQRILAPVGERE